MTDLPREPPLADLAPPVAKGGLVEVDALRLGLLLPPMPVDDEAAAPGLGTASRGAGTTPPAARRGAVEVDAAGAPRWDARREDAEPVEEDEVMEDAAEAGRATVARFEAGWKGASVGAALRLEARVLEEARGLVVVAVVEEDGGGSMDLLVVLTGEDAGRGSREDCKRERKEGEEGRLDRQRTRELPQRRFVDMYSPC